MGQAVESAFSGPHTLDPSLPADPTRLCNKKGAYGSKHFLVQDPALPDPKSVECSATDFYSGLEN